ncbi:RecX family transcriptional regulator [Serratia fonticola]|uniref:RecX family transcriptional regulator n=1 Tax=Serratia fonticola TaxID=47917 RepID=UPI00301DDE51
MIKCCKPKVFDYLEAHGKVDVDWYAMARELKVSKFGDVVVSEAKEKNKQIRYLQHKGFSMDMIFEALS